MTEPETPVANFAKPKPVETGLRIALTVTDPEVVAELQSREGHERDKYALTALRVGVLALRAAGGAVDAAKLKSEGERLINEVEMRLIAHSTKLDKELVGELEKYFDPKNGHFKKHVSELVGEDGKLVQVLKAHVEGDNSVLAMQLADAVGKDSELMRYLSPDQKDGLIQRITEAAEERLEEQSKKVLGEFDLNNDDGALNKLIKSVDSNFDVSNKESALSKMHAALDQTRKQLRADLSLDEDGSALSNLHGKLKNQIAELVERQVKFQKEVQGVLGELKGAKKERDKSPSGGFDFEDFVHDRLLELVPNTDVLSRTGEKAGLIARSKVGDHVQELGQESVAPGTKIVYESKRDDSYSLADAIEELETAKKNRGAKIGVFVLAASSVRDNKKQQADFPRTLQRYGNNIVVVWDHEDEASDVSLEAAATLARAIVVQDTAPEEEKTEVNWDAIDKAINGIERQHKYLDDFDKSCTTITRHADDVKDRAERMRKDLKREMQRLTDELETLK